MPGVRDPNKKLIGAHFDFMIVARIDKARKDLGEDRSLFIIRSVILRLRQLGLEVPAHLEPQKYQKPAVDYSHLLESEELQTKKPAVSDLPPGESQVSAPAQPAPKPSKATKPAGPYGIKAPKKKANPKGKPARPSLIERTGIDPMEGEPYEDDEEATPHAG